MWTEALIQAISHEIEELLSRKGGIALADLEYELPYPRALIFQALGKLLETRRVQVCRWGRGYLVEWVHPSHEATLLQRPPMSLCDPLSQDLD